MSSVQELLNALKANEKYQKQIVCSQLLSAKPGQYGQLNPPLPEALQDCLNKKDVQRLYAHQVKAISLLREGKNVGVVTPTASGKTLIYNLPLLEKVLHGEDLHALYLFPTKALEQDQKKSLLELAEPLGGLPPVTVEIYDGDTPSAEREKIRKSPPLVLLTNPDMVHLGLLPHHSQWAGFFKKLKWIVIDEVHTYRGIFGSHVSLVLKRLLRLCRHYGGQPQLLACSATVGKPGEFLEKLTGEAFSVITESGAPQPQRTFVLWNPESSPYTEATSLLEECLEKDLKTIVFTKSRKIAELISLWVRENPQWEPLVESYRAGYLPEERREIERRLFQNELRGVVSTSALEVGIDVGGLDACLLVGFPGTMISTWQRVGRVGRREKEALLVLIALPDALDQYWMSHPQEFFKRPLEQIVIHPGNKMVLAGHLLCAAAELPLQPEEPLAGGEAREVIARLEADNKLVRSQEWERWLCLAKNPHQGVSLRGIGDNFPLIDFQTGEILGFQDSSRAYRECYAGAVYIHQGETYEVVKLDYVNKEIFLKPFEGEFYTQPTVSEEVEILSVKHQRTLARGGQGEVNLCLGEVRVTEKVVCYERRLVADGSLISEHQLALPPQIFETESVWLSLPDGLVDELIRQEMDSLGSLHALEHALIALMPLFAICDRWDLGGISYLIHSQTKRPVIFIYDGFPGGAGLTERGYLVMEDLVQKVFELIHHCACEKGCPSCVQSPKCGNGNKPLSKHGAQQLADYARTGSSSSSVAVPLVLEKKAEEKDRDDKVSLDDKRVLYFDLETQKLAQDVGGWNNIRDMKLSVGIVFDSLDKKYSYYEENQVPQLIEKLCAADLVVGFNIKRFDYEVLRGYVNFDFNNLPTFDILELVHKQLGFRLKLEHLAQCTLQSAKAGDGLKAVEWFRQGRMDLIKQYCEMDVALTRDLFQFGLKNGYLLFRDQKSQELLRMPFKFRL